MSLEWTASQMCEWIQRLQELDACYAAGSTGTADIEEITETQPAWTKNAVETEMTQAEKANRQLWEQFSRETAVPLFRQIAGCEFGQYYLKAAEQSIQNKEKYQGAVQGQSAECSSERAKLHFTAEEALQRLSVFAELADTVNQLADTKDRRAYRQACVRFSVWTAYAAEKLAELHKTLSEELAKQTAETEAKSAEQKKSFSERLHSMREQTGKDASAEQGTSGSAESKAVSESGSTNTAAAIKEIEFTKSYPPERIQSEYMAKLAQIKAPANYQTPEALLSEVLFGTLIFDLKAAGFRQETITFLERTYPYFATDTELRMPLCLPLDKAMNCVFRFPGADAGTVLQLAAQLLTELLMLLSPEYLHLLRITDSHYYLDKLALFQRLVDPRREESKKAVYDSVRMQKADVLKGMEEVLKHRSYVSQQVLQGVYDTLREYHLEKPQSTEAYTIAAALLDPEKADAEIMDKMAELAEAGPSCGIFTWLFDTSLKEPAQQKSARVCRHLPNSFVYDSESGTYSYFAQASTAFPLRWEPLPFPNAVASTRSPDERQKQTLKAQQILLDRMRELRNA